MENPEYDLAVRLYTLASSLFFYMLVDLDSSPPEGLSEELQQAEDQLCAIYELTMTELRHRTSNHLFDELLGWNVGQHEAHGGSMTEDESIKGLFPFSRIVWHALAMNYQEGLARETRGEPPLFVMSDIPEDTPGLQTFKLPLEDLAEEEDDGL